MTTNEIDATRPGNGAGAAPGRQRIAKLMARVGLCSRRDAEAWIVEGRVNVNGAVLTSPATDVGPDDAILVDGTPLPTQEKTRLFLFHKPRGLVTSDHDPEGRPTVADHLRATWPQGPRVVTVGRLDINTEGLLLLTNDGGLARVLELPRTGWVRRYRVRANGATDQGVLDGLRGGIAIDGVDYAGIEATLDRVQGANVWLTMALREGKNREVKRVLEHIGLGVNRLIRLSFGPFQLGDLTEGAVEEVRTRVLRDQLGEALARAAGVDFREAAAAPQARGERPRDDRPRAERPAGERRDTRRTERPGGERRGDGPRLGRDAGALRARGGPRRHEAVEPPPPRRERPATGTRKHVSVLRADEASAKGPRKRTERADVKDRRDRSVAVERRVAARSALEPTRSRRPGGRAASDDVETRPRRQASPSAEAKRARAARSGAGAGTQRPEKETRRGFRGGGDRRERERSPSGKGSGTPASGRGRTETTGGENRPTRSRHSATRGTAGGPLATSTSRRGRGTDDRAKSGDDAAQRQRRSPSHARRAEDARGDRKSDDKRTQRPPSRDGKPRGKPGERTQRPPRAGKPGDKPRGKPPRPRR